MSWRIEPLSSNHTRDEFDCGYPQLNRYIIQLAGQHQKKRLSRTCVAVAHGDDKVVGYYTLTASAIAFEEAHEELTKSFPAYPMPLFLLGKLAVDNSRQGHGLGRLLLGHALERALQATDLIGAVAVEVHAIDDTAATFYRRFGFQQLSAAANHLYLPMQQILKSQDGS